GRVDDRQRPAPPLSDVRGARASDLRPQLRPMRVLPVRHRRGIPQGAVADYRISRSPGRPCLRARPPGDALHPRRGLPVPGLRLGGPAVVRRRVCRARKPERGLPVGLARRPLRRTLVLHREPQPGRLGFGRRQARILSGSPLRTRGPRTHRSSQKGFL
ncbi:MAG: hypothetical protein AVDCRST_MAG12-3660, partial [uncultured Rubrobacteraceae bacterium]